MQGLGVGSSNAADFWVTTSVPGRLMVTAHGPEVWATSKPQSEPGWSLSIMVTVPKVPCCPSTHTGAHTSMHVYTHLKCFPHQPFLLDVTFLLNLKHTEQHPMCLRYLLWQPPIPSAEHTKKLRMPRRRTSHMGVPERAAMAQSFGTQV